MQKSDLVIRIPLGRILRPTEVGNNFNRAHEEDVFLHGIMCVFVGLSSPWKF